MTMQVGMVGTDGVLIASDTKSTDMLRISPREQPYRPRHTFDASKIILNHVRGIAVSCARVTATARRIAEHIFSELRDQDLPYPCEPIKQIGEALLPKLGDDDLLKDAHCLIATVLPIPSLYLFHYGNDVDGNWGANCTKMRSTIAAGDHVNAAIFWKERYYQRKSIKSLVPLAAHLVVSASMLNSGSIGGLEIVLCDASGLHRIAEDSIRKLEAKANKWDEEIGSMFANYRQHFTFAPKDAG